MLLLVINDITPALVHNPCLSPSSLGEKTNYYRSLKGAGIAQSAQRRVMGWKDGARFPERARDFSLLHSV
jgi:hypothetical protein